jgi:hypothetical protein
MQNLDPTERGILEMTLNRCGLVAVIRALADIAGERARRARSDRRDEVMAKAWESTATYLYRVSDTKTVRACPLA